MLSVIQIVTNNTPELLRCMEDSLSIYDQALYYQRQEFLVAEEKLKSSLK